MIEGPRAARKDELRAIVAMVNGVFYPEGNFDMGAYFPMLFSEPNLDNLRIVLEEGSPAALVGFTLRDLSLGGPVLRAACIGAVCTDARHRGKGLASQLMDDAVQKAREQGAAAILVSGGRGLYRRMGCVNAGLYRLLAVTRKGMFPSLPCSVKEWTPADLPEMQALHQGEAVRFMRDPAEMRTLLEARALFCRPARTWVVRDKEKLLAYLCAGEPADLAEKGRLIVREIAGSRLAVLASLPVIMESCRVDRLEVETTESDVEMRTLAETLSLPFSPVGFHGTVKIIDRPGLLRVLQSQAAERLSPEERARLQINLDLSVSFSYDGQRLELDSDAELASLVFGSREEKPLSPDGRLGEILSRLFPLPLPRYGVSYI